jgi:putative protease
VVKAYSEALDALVAGYPERYERASFGHVCGGFTPDLNKTFNRGYTELFLDGKRGQWAAEGGGEYVGTVQRPLRDGFVLDPAHTGIQLANGDGFTFEGGGFRADVCEGYTVYCKKVEGLAPGTKLFRNISAAFERRLESAKPVREIPVQLQVALQDGAVAASARTEDGREVRLTLPAGADKARDPERMLQSLREQLAKRSGHYAFGEPSVQVDGPVPFLPVSALNGLRRDLAAQLDAQPVQARPLYRGTKKQDSAFQLQYESHGELMRSKYCVRHELGLCPKQGKVKKAEPLFLRNGKERLQLSFDCAVCEMTVTTGS